MVEAYIFRDQNKRMHIAYEEADIKNYMDSEMILLSKTPMYESDISRVENFWNALDQMTEAYHHLSPALREGVVNMNGDKLINDLSEFVAKELDRYGEIIHDHDWVDGPEIIRSKSYVYNNKFYDVTRINGVVKYIYFGGELDA